MLDFLDHQKNVEFTEKCLHWLPYAFFSNLTYISYSGARLRSEACSNLLSKRGILRKDFLHFKPSFGFDQLGPNK